MADITFTPEPGSISPPLDLLTKDINPQAREILDARSPMSQFREVEPNLVDAGGAKQIDLNARERLGGFRSPMSQFKEVAPRTLPGFKEADDFDVKSVEELDKARDVFSPVEYFTNNPDVAKDPKKLAKLLEVARRRYDEGLTAKGVAAAAVKNTPGLIADIAGGIKRFGERAIDVVVQPTANVVLGTLTGDLFDDQKRAALFSETRKVIKKGTAEVGAGSEAATVGLVDLARTGANKVEPLDEGVFFNPTGGGSFYRPKSEDLKPIKNKKTDQEVLAQLSDDASFRQVADAAMRGEGEAAKAIGLDKEALAKQGIEIDEKAIQQLSLVDPVTMIATGGAFKLVGVGGKVLGAARTIEGAQQLADKLAQVAKFSAGKGIQYSGTATKAVGKVLQGSGRSASLITGIGAATRGAGPLEALAIAGATKMVGPTVRKVGALAEHFGKSITGEVPVTVAGQKLLDYARPVGSAVSTVSKGAVEGIVAASPFALAAQDDETAGALLGAGSALGAAGAAGAGAFRVVKNAAAREYFGQNRPVLPDVPSPGYGKDAALDAQHASNIQKLSAQDASELNNFREVLRQQGGEIYAVDQATWNQKIAEAHPNATPEDLATYASHSAFNDVAIGPDRRVVYLNADIQGTKGLQHDAGHIFDAILSPEKREELRKAITEAFPKKSFDDFKATYERLKKGPGISDTALKDEFIAEQFAALFNNVPVTEMNAPRSLLKIFVDAAAEAAETLGINITSGAETPNIGAPVSVGIRKLFQNAAGEVTKAKIEGVPPTNVTPPIDFGGGGGLPVPTAPRPPSTPPGNISPLFPSAESASPGAPNTRVTPETVSSFKQSTKSPESTAAREAAAASYAENGIGYARTEAKKAEGSPTSQIIERISDSMESGNPVVQIEHLGITSESTPAAPAGDIKRTAEQDKGYKKLTKAQNEVRENAPADVVALHSKNFVPVRWVEEGGRPTLIAMSLDKVISNILKVVAAPESEGLLPYPVEKGKLTPEGWKQAVADLQAYSENQSNGRKGDGGKLTVPEAGELSIPAENPSYTPKMLSPERANFQNLVQGLETPKTTKPGSKETAFPGNIKAQFLAEANARPTELPARISAKNADKQAFVKFPPRVIQEVNPLRNALERRGFNHRDLLKVTEHISAKDIKSATSRPDINYKAPVTDIIRGGFLPSIENPRLRRNSNFPHPDEETFYWVSPDGGIFEAGKGVDALEESAFNAGFTSGEDILQPLLDDGWDYFSIDPAIERFKLGNGTLLEPNQMSAIKKWSDNLGFRMQDEKGNLHDFTKEIAQDRKEKAIASALEPGHFLPAPTEFRQKNLGGRTVEEFSDYVLKAAPTEWKAATENMTGGLTGGAWNLGLGLKDAADVAVLKSFQDRLSTATKEAMSSGDFDSAYSLVSKGQFFREAYEAATGTGSAGAAFKRGTAGMESAKPPFPIEKGGANFLPAEQLEVGTSEQTPELRVLPAAAGGTPPIEPPGFRPPPVAAGVAAKDEEAPRFAPKPDETIRDLAKSYADGAGIPYAPRGGYAEVKPDLAKRLADFYEAAKSNPNDPEVAASYDALIRETEEQGKSILAAGYKIEPWTGAGEPYKNSAAAIADVRDNKHLFFRKTEGAFAGTADNPMLAESTLVPGQSVNDVFRWVHDFFGHSKEGFQFGPRGEFNAWRSHSEMYSPDAQGALAAETLAQNSWVNFGKHLEGKNIPQAERPFAEQKNVLVPKELIDEATGAANKYIRVNDPGFLGEGETFYGPIPEGRVKEALALMGEGAANRGRYNAKFKVEDSIPEGTRISPIADFFPNSPSARAEVAKFLPRTDSGRKLEEKGFEIVPSGELGIRRVSVTKDGNEVAVIQSVQRSPQRAEISMVQKYQGAPKGVGEVLYRELGSQLRDDGVTELTGSIISPEPLAIRRKVFGDFASIKLNDEPATFDQAIATAERVQNRTEREVAAIEPVNTISDATRFLPRVKRDAQGRPLTKSGEIDYAKWQKEGLAARRKQEAEPIEEATPRGKVTKDSGSSTGWILPDKKFVPLDTDFHESYLAENAASLNKKFKTNFSEVSSPDERLAALNAGFVRLRNVSGGMKIEANAAKWPTLKSKVLETLQDRAGSFDSVTLSLLNNKGQQVDSTSALRLHELSAPEKLNAIEEAVGSLRPGTAGFLPWNNFPDAVVHTSIAKLASNEKYAAAKAGNMRAAISVVAPLVKLDLFKPLAEQHPEAILVPVIAEELRGRNKLPLALAKILSRETGLEVTTDIVQANRAHHTGATDLERAFRIPKFDGVITKGAEYILVDDVSTSGATFAALRDYITKKGGNVVGATALGAAHRPGRGYGGHLAPTPENLARLKKFDNAEISSILKKYDLALDSLSNGQLGILLRELDRAGLNGLRNSLAKGGRKPSR